MLLSSPPRKFLLMTSEVVSTGSFHYSVMCIILIASSAFIVPSFCPLHTALPFTILTVVIFYIELWSIFSYIAHWLYYCFIWGQTSIIQSDWLKSVVVYDNSVLFVYLCNFSDHQLQRTLHVQRFVDTCSSNVLSEINGMNSTILTASFYWQYFSIDIIQAVCVQLNHCVSNECIV